jgi:NAD(P)H-quinone oxidoreductase subunit 5
MRTLQLLRAPSMLRDYRQLEDNLGYSIAGRVAKAYGGGPSSEVSPSRLWCYRLAMERGHFDTVLDERIGRPFVRLFQRFDSWERRWNRRVSGRRSDAVSAVADEPEVP